MAAPHESRVFRKLPGKSAHNGGRSARAAIKADLSRQTNLRDRL